MSGKSQGELPNMLPNFEDPNKARITQYSCVLAGDYIVHSTMLVNCVRLSGSQTCLSGSPNAFYCYNLTSHYEHLDHRPMAEAELQSTHQIAVPEESILFVEALIIGCC